MSPSHSSVASVAIYKADRQNRRPGLVTRPAPSWQAETTLHKTATALCQGPLRFPRGQLPHTTRNGPFWLLHGPWGGTSRQPQPRESDGMGAAPSSPLSPGARGGRDTTPPDRGLQWTPRSAARPCPGRRDTSGPSGAGSPLPAARRSLPPRRGARGPRARREKSAVTPQCPSSWGAAGGIGPRFPGLSLRAARGDRGLQRPARPRPQVASFPCRPSEPGGGEAGRGTCAKRYWSGGRRAAGLRAPQPLPG